MRARRHVPQRAGRRRRVPRAAGQRRASADRATDRGPPKNDAGPPAARAPAGGPRPRPAPCTTGCDRGESLTTSSPKDADEEEPKCSDECGPPPASCGPAPCEDMRTDTTEQETYIPDIPEQSTEMSSETTPKMETTSISFHTVMESNQLQMDFESTTNISTTTLASVNSIMDAHSRGSNECLAPRSGNTTLESIAPDELEFSNESCAEVTDEWSDGSPPARARPRTPARTPADTLTRKGRDPEWVDIGSRMPHEDISRHSNHDTWNDDTCPDDVTFPTLSASFHLVSSRHELEQALPDLLEKREGNIPESRPDLTDKLGEQRGSLEEVPEPSFASLVDDNDHQLDSIIASAIEKEAARLAAQLKISQYGMENSVTSLTSLDLDNVRPPSNLGSLLSLSTSGHWDDPKKSKSRKKSLPVALMVKRALGNSIHHSSENLDSNPISFLENVKPPSEMDNIDMEGSMVSVSSIVSEVVEIRERTPVVFDLKQPIQDFPLCNNFTVLHDLDKVNPPSLFDEMAESTIEIDQTTAHQVYDDCVSNTLNVVTDIPSGSENCTPLPSDVSSVESTPKRQRDPHYLTPKEKRYISKDRYQTYTITDTADDTEIVLEVEEEEFLTWTKSESDRSEEYVTATSEPKLKRKISAKQRRLEDRARYQTQTVDIQNIMTQESSQPKVVDPHIESLKRRLAAKKTMKQKRIEDAERFRTRTLSEDIPPSPTFVTKDANFENLETTTGYDSLSSNELNHQQLVDSHRDDDARSRDADSGHNEDDCELNSTRMQTYTRSFRNYLPVVESPAAVDLCVLNNLKNIEMTASFDRTRGPAAPAALTARPASGGDLAGSEGDGPSDDLPHSESDPDAAHLRPKPKIVKPAPRRDRSLDSDESVDREPDAPKVVRGRKKAAYVSPYRRTAPAARRPAPAPAPATPAPKASQPPRAVAVATKSPGGRAPARPPAARPPGAAASPKKAAPSRSPTKTGPKPAAAPPAAKPLPLERQGTFTKEESSVPPAALPATGDPAPTGPGTADASPSRLRPPNRYARPARVAKPASRPGTGARPESAMKSSPSNHSLHSNDSGKTVTPGGRAVRPGAAAAGASKDVESKIANLWKRVEQSKRRPPEPDRRVWIEPAPEPPRLLRSSTFEGRPRVGPAAPAGPAGAAPKQKSAIGMKVSQIPSPRAKCAGRGGARRPAFARKPTPGQVDA